MWYKEDNFVVKIGSNFYVDTPRIIVYKGEDLFSITRAESNEQLGIDFTIYNSLGVKVAEVKKGRIYAKNSNAYLTLTTPKEYKLIEKLSGRIICWIKKNMMENFVELEVNVSMYTKDGFLIEATPDYTNLGSSMLIGNTFQNCGAAIAIN